MPELPNPFLTSVAEPSTERPAAVSSPPIPTGETAAGIFVFDEKRFIAELEDELARLNEALPMFLSAPRPEYLKAADLRPIVEVLAGY